VPMDPGVAAKKPVLTRSHAACQGNQCVEQDGRGCAVDIHLFAGADTGDGLIGTDESHQLATGTRQTSAVEPVARAAVTTGLSFGLSRAAPGS